MSYFCKEFGCLPSELENEDIVVLRRVHAARTLQQTLKECGEDIFDRTPEQFKLLTYIKDLREWLAKNKDKNGQ